MDLERRIQKGNVHTPLLIAHTSKRAVIEDGGRLLSWGLVPKSQISQSEVTGQFYQWWRKVDDAAKECPWCGAGLLYYKNNGERVCCTYEPCGYDMTVKGHARLTRDITIWLMREDGYSVREIARAFGLSKSVVHTISSEFLYEPDSKCKCGEPIGHRGWCSWRFKRSEKRQAFMDRWHSTHRRTKGTSAVD